MPEKTAVKSHKRQYMRPQITRVRLDIKTTVMGDCWNSTFQFAVQGDCGFVEPCST
jgi:hypothetical protein